MNRRGVLLILASSAFVSLVHSAPMPAFARPVAAHCAGYGLCWFAITTLKLLSESFDGFCLYFGLVNPNPPTPFVKEITSTSFKIYWFSPPHQVKAIKEHHIEVNGVVIGKSKHNETSLIVHGLDEEETYVVVVRVLSRKGSSASTPMVIRTTKSIPIRSNEPEAPKSKIRDPEPETKPKLELRDPKEDLVTHSMLQEASDAIHEIRKQILEIERSQKEFEEAHQLDESQLRGEIQKVRELKKQEEASKLKLKQKLKLLEESKAKTDFLKVKLEKEYRIEQTARETLQAKIEMIQTQLTKTIKEIQEQEKQNEEAEKGNERQKQQALFGSDTLKLGFQHDQLKLQELRLKRDSIHGNLQELLEKKNSETIKLAQFSTSCTLTQESQKKLKLQWKTIEQEYNEVAKQHQTLQDELHRETQIKMRLLQELAKARNEKESQATQPADNSPPLSNLPPPPRSYSNQSPPHPSVHLPTPLSPPFTFQPGSNVSQVPSTTTNFSGGTYSPFSSFSPFAGSLPTPFPAFGAAPGNLSRSSPSLFGHANDGSPKPPSSYL